MQYERELRKRSFIEEKSPTSKKERKVILVCVGALARRVLLKGNMV